MKRQEGYYFCKILGHQDFEMFLWKGYLWHQIGTHEHLLDNNFEVIDERKLIRDENTNAPSAVLRDDVYTIRVFDSISHADAFRKDFKVPPVEYNGIIEPEDKTKKPI